MSDVTVVDRECINSDIVTTPVTYDGGKFVRATLEAVVATCPIDDTRQSLQGSGNILQG